LRGRNTVSEQAWYLVAAVVAVVIVLALVFRRGRLKGTVEGFGLKAGLEGSGPDGKEPAATPGAPPGVTARSGGIAVGRDATGQFNTGDDARVSGDRKR
jgi:hypothetical protein